MRVVVYARVSSAIQRDKQTIASQLTVVPAAVERMGWKVVDTVIDDGRSAATGKLAKREGFSALLARMASEPRNFDAVAVIDADRITRTESMREQGTICGAFQDSGVELFIASTSKRFDLRDPNDRLILGISLWQSGAENAKRRERVIRGKAEAIRQNRKPAGPTPFGLVYSREAGWSKDPELGPIVVEIYRRISKGETCEAVATDLNDRRVMRCRPSKTGKRKPGRWNRERIHQICRSTTYTGSWIANKAKALTVKVPALVSDELWHAADAQLARYSQRGRRRTKHVYLVQGAGRCGICGANMVPVSTLSGAAKVWYYTCARRRRPPTDGRRCTLPMRRLDDIDSRVWKAVAGVITQPRVVEAALKRQQTAVRSIGALADSVGEAEAKLKQYDTRCEKMADQYRRGVLPESVWEGHLDAMARERPALVRALDQSKAGVSAATTQQRATAGVLEAMARLRAKLKDPDPKSRRDLVRALIPGTGDHVVTIDKDGGIRLKVVLSESTCTSSVTELRT